MAISKQEDAEIKERSFEEAVQTRGAGIWAGAAFGLAYGAAAGLLIALAPVAMFGAAFSWPVVAGAAALFAGIGAVAGRNAGGENGSSAGAVAYGTKKMLGEMRGQFRGLRQEIQSLRQGTAAAPASPAADSVTTQADADDAPDKSLFNWKVFAASLAAGAAGGALIGFGADLIGGGPIISSLAGLGFTTPAQQIAGSALVGSAAFGLFGFNVPNITARWHMTGRHLSSGKIFEEGLTPQPDIVQEKAPEKMPEKAPENVAMQDAQARTYTTTTHKQVASYQEYLTVREQDGTAQTRPLA